MHRIVIWGTGRKAGMLLDQLDSSRFEILTFVDSDSSKQHGMFKGYSVLPPSTIPETEYDYVCIASYDHFFEIKKQLKNLGVTSHIISFTDLTHDGDTVSPVIGLRDGRVWLKKVCTYVAHACNLRCKYCNHFSQFGKGRVIAEDVVSWIETWSPLVCPDNFYLAGGEPLLNKNLDSVLHVARKAWPKTKLHLYTNGMLLPRLSQTVVEAIRETQANLIISKHYDNKEFKLKFEQAMNVLKEYQLPNDVWNCFDTWTKFYNLSDDNKPLPWRSDPSIAHRVCARRTGGRSVSLLGNKLYKCYVLSMVDHYLASGGVLDGNWDLFGYMPLERTATVEEIISHLSPISEAACCQCPEFVEFVPPERFKTHPRSVAMQGDKKKALI